MKGQPPKPIPSRHVPDLPYNCDKEGGLDRKSVV